MDLCSGKYLLSKVLVHDLISAAFGGRAHSSAWQVGIPCAVFATDSLSLNHVPTLLACHYTLDDQPSVISIVI